MNPGSVAHEANACGGHGGLCVVDMLYDMDTIITTNKYNQPTPECRREATVCFVNDGAMRLMVQSGANVLICEGGPRLGWLKHVN